jgi:transposase-like protein
MKDARFGKMEAAISQLRNEIEALPMNQAGKRRGISDDLRRKIVQALRESGATVPEFAAAVSVSAATLHAWRKNLTAPLSPASKRTRADRSAGFKQISVKGPDPVILAPTYTLEGPGGIRVTGLTAENLAQLWKSLC